MKSKFLSPVIRLILLVVFIPLVCFQTDQKEKAKTKPVKSTQKATQPSGKSCFLVISDIHLNSLSQGFGKPGSDTPEGLWKAAQDEIKKILATADPVYGKPKFILFLGDMPLHSVNKQLRTDNIKTVLTDLKKLGADNKIEIIMAPGNNDPADSDYAKFSGQATFKIDEAGYKDMCYPVINGKNNDQQFITSAEDGWYEYSPVQNLKVVVMNTIPFTNRGMKGCHQQAVNEINWLDKILNEDDKKVIIAMHVPPGKDGYDKAGKGDYKDLWCKDVKDGDGEWVQQTFLNQLKLHADKIVGVISSHTHMDGVRKLEYADNGSGNDYTILVSAPSISRDHYNNPAVKVIGYDDNTLQLQDFCTYYLQDVTALGKPTWNNYWFKKEFGCPTEDNMRACIDGLTNKQLSDLVSKIYYTRATPPNNNNHPEVTIEVNAK